MRRVVVIAVAALMMAGLAWSQQRSQSGLVTAPEQRPTIESPKPSMTVEELEEGGDRARELKLYLDAIDYYAMGLKKIPREDKKKQAIFWNKRGIAELQLAKLREAEKSFKRATKADKTYAEAFNNSGVVQYKKKKFGRAVSDYERALELNEASASFHSNLGTAYFDMKNYPKALEHFRRAIQIDPQIFERMSGAGISAHLSSPEDRARFSYTLARMYAKAGNFERSLFYLRRAIEDGYKGVNDAYKEDDFSELRKDARFEDLMGANRPVSISQ